MPLALFTDRRFDGNGRKLVMHTAALYKRSDGENQRGKRKCRRDHDSAPGLSEPSIVVGGLDEYPHHIMLSRNRRRCTPER